ncbi:MAG: phosphorylase [Bryocella sp.]
MIAIIAALPREISGLVGGEAADPLWRKRGVWLYRKGDAVIVAGGMGAERATLAFEAAIGCGVIETVVSTGLAGACESSVEAGSVVEAGTVIDTRTGERYRTMAHNASALLATTSGIAGVAEKQRLSASYAAAMVDMEAATVARLAASRGVSFRAIKGISDPHDFEMASLSRFAGKHGTFRTGAFAAYTAMRPHTWGRAMRLGKYSSQSLAALHRKLREEFQLDVRA